MMTVFFVDDEESVLKSFQRLLKMYSSSYLFRFFSSGQAALDCDLIPDVLVTDAKMAGMSGSELIDRFRMHYPRLITVMLSGEAEPDIHSNDVIDHFLEKPCDVKEILSILSGIV
jgi:FixJ family two-component response regulator